MASRWDAEDLEDYELDELSELLEEALTDAVDDPSLTEGLDALDELVADGDWRTVLQWLCAAEVSRRVLADLVDAGVSVRALMLYVVLSEARLCAAYEYEIPWSTLQSQFLGRDVDLLLCELVFLLEDSALDYDRFAPLAAAWLRAADEAAPDELYVVLEPMIKLWTDVPDALDSFAYHHDLSFSGEPRDVVDAVLVELRR